MKKIIYISFIFLLPFVSFGATVYISNDNNEINYQISDFSVNSSAKIGEFTITEQTDFSNGGEIWFKMWNDSGYCSGDWLRLYVGTSTTAQYLSTQLFEPSTTTPTIYKKQFWNSGLTTQDNLILEPDTYNVYASNQCNFVNGLKIFGESKGNNFYGLIFDNEGSSLITLQPTSINELIYPPNASSFRSATSTNFTFDFFYNSNFDAPFYDMALVQYVDINNNITHFTQYNYITQQTGYYTNTTNTVEINRDSLYRWRAVLRDSTNNNPDIYSAYNTFSTMASSTLMTLDPTMISEDTFTSVYDYENLDMKGMEATICSKAPFSLMCQAYDTAISISKTPQSVSSSTVLLEFDMSSTTSALSNEAGLGSSGIAKATMLTGATLQYFFPDNVSEKFRQITQAGIVLMFLYMVYSRIMSLWNYKI